MKIVYIASVRIPNEKASGLAIMRQCEAFSDIGNQVTLIRPSRKNHIKDDPFDYYGINKIFEIITMKSVDFVDRFGVLGFYYTRLSQIVTSFFVLYKNRNVADVVYARDPWMLVLPILFFKHKKKIVWEAHQVQKGVFVSFVARYATLLVCISSGLGKYYARSRGLKKIIIEPSGVNIEQFDHLPSTAEVRYKLNLPLDKKIIAYIGKYKTMGEEKGIDELIKVFAKIYKTQQDIHLFIAGLENDEIGMLMHTCTEKELPQNAYTLQSLIQKDFAQYVHSADILIMNYPDLEHYRNFMSPTKLFAYMGSRKVIVVSDLPSVREIVDESMVFFTKPSDIPSLTDALKRAHGSLGTGEEMQQKAYEKVKVHTWYNRARRIIDAIRVDESITYE